MHRRAKMLLIMFGAIALCVGTCGITMAVASERGTSIPSTESVRACATDSGFLRLASNGKCPAKTSSVSLARPALAPKALSVLFTAASGSKATSLSLLGGSSLKATCSKPKDSPLQAHLIIRNAGQTRIDGTSSFVHSGDSSFSFDRENGSNGQNVLTGAEPVYETTDGEFSAFANNGYATANLHLLITVPGAVFTVTGIIEDNAGSGYCRIAAEVDSATT